MCEVFGYMEGLYSKTWYLREGDKLREYKRSSSRIWKKAKCRT